ncbi:hypothetical protein T07_3305 [Trichinella nelsoni]|uniref:Uncharacterized protein n=1 Tax=Trichinella nelsoni TaxID=6336 RepID=A0A0V0RCW1_9BILA|nr:hypothetical protein T07_3305 [Trichinella nelsoni]
MPRSWFVQSRFLSFSCFMADPTYYENFALSVPLAQGYIDRLGEIWFQMVSVSRHVSFKRDDILIKHTIPHIGCHMLTSNSQKRSKNQ